MFVYKIDGKYWIEADIQKTGIKGHRVPIDDDLAQTIAGMISKVKNEVDRDINPCDLIFPSETIIRVLLLFKKGIYRQPTS